MHVLSCGTNLMLFFVGNDYKILFDMQCSVYLVHPLFTFGILVAFILLPMGLTYIHARREAKKCTKNTCMALYS